MTAANFLKTLPKLSILLLFVPVSIALSLLHSSSIVVFVCTALAILGLASLLSKSVEELSIYCGPVLGGFLSATFGNFTELVIGILALKKGLFTLVSASITGSILGNLLLVMGLSMFLGGLKHKTQKFSRTGANASILMLVVAVVALIMPSFIHYGYGLDKSLNLSMANTMVDEVSFFVALVLLVIYVLSLVFSLKTHRFVYLSESSGAEEKAEKADWSKSLSFIALAVVAILVSFESDIFVDAIESMIKVQHIRLSEMFLGVVVVAAIGNAVDGLVSIKMARRNKMNISFQVAMGASTQIALLVAPLFVVISTVVFKNPFPLVFNVFELLAIFSGVFIAGYSLLDGESNWFEGAMFLAVYLIAVVVFFFHP